MDLNGLPAPGSPDEAAAIARSGARYATRGRAVALDAFLAAFEKGGGIVEERITGEV